MKIRFVKSLAIAYAMLAGSTAFGQDYFALEDTSVETVSYKEGGDGCQKACDDNCGKGCGGILDGIGDRVGGGAYLDLELLYFQAGRGVQHNINGQNNPCSDFEIAPRISIGYVGCGGLGIRFRYFDFAHSAGVGLNQLNTPGQRNILYDTYNLDLELFEEIQIGCATSVEWSAGVRYNDFKYRDVVLQSAAPTVNAFKENFSGFGLIFGLQINRCLGPGNIYGRARWAALHADSWSQRELFNQNPAVPEERTDFCDSFRMQTEIALGYEVSRCTGIGVVTGRIGYEVQMWNEYAVGHINPTPSPFLRRDVPRVGQFGFHGFVLGLELAR